MFITSRELQLAAMHEAQARLQPTRPTNSGGSESICQKRGLRERTVKSDAFLFILARKLAFEIQLCRYTKSSESSHLALVLYGFKSNEDCMANLHLTVEGNTIYNKTLPDFLLDPGI